VVEGARYRGVKVPDGLSVVGFDDIDAAKYADLTTVRQPLYESGREAVRILLRYMEGDEPLAIPRQLSLELIVRGSTSRAD
jgi:DNA-binding LacI/PurR family transcriptional regulator